MQIHSSNGSLQQRVFSGTGTIGGIHLPDFNDKYVYTKKKSGIRKNTESRLQSRLIKTSKTALSRINRKALTN